MSLKSIQLATITPINRATDQYQVDAYSDDGKLNATFKCTGEQNAIALRNAIREHADTLHHVTNYR